MDFPSHFGTDMTFSHALLKLRHFLVDREDISDIPWRQFASDHRFQTRRESKATFVDVLEAIRTLNAWHHSSRNARFGSIEAIDAGALYGWPREDEDRITFTSDPVCSQDVIVNLGRYFIPYDTRSGWRCWVSPYPTATRPTEEERRQATLCLRRFFAERAGLFGLDPAGIDATLKVLAEN